MSIVDVTRALSGAVAPAALAVIGAVARNAWAAPRATTDLDLCIAAASEPLRAVEEALDRLGYRRVRCQQTDPADAQPDLLVFRKDDASLRQVDLLPAKTLFEREALARATPVDLAGVAMRVISPEDLVVYKLIAFRPRDREDILAVARARARAGHGIDWAYVSRWASQWAIDDRLATIRRDLEP